MRGPYPKALVKGKEMPDSPAPGKLRVYSMRFCPFAQRALLVLEHKKIDFEMVNIALGELKPEWFVKEKNPNGTVPVIEKDGRIVYESLIVAEYLDAVYPGNTLAPPDPYRKARDAMLIDYYGKQYIQNYYKIVFSKGENQEAATALLEGLQKLEEELTARGKFFGGANITMIDLMLWPWLENRVGVITRLNPKVVVSASSFPKLNQWINDMKTLDAVKACLRSTDEHMLFYKKWADKTADAFDVGIEAA